MDDHQHTPDVMDVLREQIVQTTLSTISAPKVQNELIGKVMQHVGLQMLYSSHNYTGIDTSSFLAVPEPFDNSHTALILTNKVVRSANAYTLIVEAIVEGDQAHFKVSVFQMDDLDASKTSFIKLEEAMESEILRQLGTIVNRSGHMHATLIVQKNFFGAEPAQEPVGLPEPTPVE